MYRLQVAHFQTKQGSVKAGAALKIRQICEKVGPGENRAKIRCLINNKNIFLKREQGIKRLYIETELPHFWPLHINFKKPLENPRSTVQLKTPSNKLSIHHHWQEIVHQNTFYMQSLSY